uniref:soluble calcium-activated nucleotidase 1 isoform X2 n=1 Tax=Ciona intestinalis TaxID=7719 RepID=UPI00089DC19C|nr:soluble calcium-activated nucleotidase 1 isoform X2 [Ciona intestinalis]|eukprot:XP_018672053.1 soluble calcium-activated nucleotidase 1 isoform X2 [Ciona intestinalis]
MMYKSVSFSSFASADVDVEAWRTKIDVPVFSRAGKTKGAITFKRRPIIVALIFIICFLSFSYYTTHPAPTMGGQHTEVQILQKVTSYNTTYPLTRPIVTSQGMTMRIGMITDMDVSSRCNFGRGMEMSEMVVFDGKVLVVDDRTGIVYHVIGNRIAPWVILSDGDGTKAKGFKGEWMTIKDETLIVGAAGKEWTTRHGVFMHRDPQWVKTIDKYGAVRHFDWTTNYRSMQRASGHLSPGYIIHESCAWSKIHNAWFFLPRRVSSLRYNDVLDQQRGGNILFKCNHDFTSVQVITIGDTTHRERGYSSFKFIPGTNDGVIVALKTVELNARTQTYVTSFTLEGNILLPDTLVSDNYKFEGFEFL